MIFDEALKAANAVVAMKDAMEETPRLFEQVVSREGNISQSVISTYARLKTMEVALFLTALRDDPDFDRTKQTVSLVEIAALSNSVISGICTIDEIRKIYGETAADIVSCASGTEKKPPEEMAAAIQKSVETIKTYLSRKKE